MYLPTFLPLTLFLTLFLTIASAQSPPPDASPSYTNTTLFRTSMLATSNTYRAQHNASKLAWNESLEADAQEWSDNCLFGHSSNPSGENLAAGYPNVSAAVISWGAERDRYNFHRGDYSTATGHFTQLVWRATQTVGCARSFCNAGAEGGKGTAPGWFVVCEYWPGGNVIGAFGENVQPYVKVEDEAREDKDVPGMEGRGGREGVSGWTLGLGVLGALGLVW